MAALRQGGIKRARTVTAIAKRLGSAPVANGMEAFGERADRDKSEFLRMSQRWAAPSMDDIVEIRAGLAVRILDGLNSLLPGVIYRIVPKSTLATLRKRSDRLPPEQSNRVYQAGKVIGFAMTIYGDEDQVRDFLTRRHPMLKDERPLDVALASGAGADRVINLLGRGAYGGGA